MQKLTVPYLLYPAPQVLRQQEADRQKSDHDRQRQRGQPQQQPNGDTRGDARGDQRGGSAGPDGPGGGGN